MKKKMTVIGIIVIVVIIAFLGGWYYLFCYMGIGPAFPFLPERKVSIENTEGGIIADNQLMALVETEEEAKSIAEQYGIELMSFSEGVAEYRTEEDLDEVIARGQNNGYPALYINMVRTSMEDTD